MYEYLLKQFIFLLAEAYFTGGMNEAARTACSKHIIYKRVTLPKTNLKMRGTGDSKTKVRITLISSIL